MTRAIAGLGTAAMLTHFTRASRAGDALDNLVEILRGGVIRGASRMVRGKSPAVCLFDAPLSRTCRIARAQKPPPLSALRRRA